MYRCFTEIKFAANPDSGSGRAFGFTCNFVNSFEAVDSWVDLTNQAKITLPKNIYVEDDTGNRIPLGGTNSDKLIDNLFRRGDQVSISYGYYTYDQYGREFLDQSEVFVGYISRVSSKKPIVLECEDNMWLLKQIPCTPMVWPKDKTVEDLLRYLLQGTNFTVNGLTETTIGDFIIGNESVCQLLDRIRKDYHLEAYFFGNELRIGSVVYVQSEAREHNFVFQQNIIGDELQFNRKDDVKLSAVVNSVITEMDGVNKKGQVKTKEKRLQVLVYADQNGEFKYIEKTEGSEFPANTEGERRTLFYPNVKTAKELADRGIDELKKYYYSGFKGKFTTFAIPYVRIGDNVNLYDRVLPDRNGKYKVRSVTYTGGVAGHRQIIELDYKLAS